MKRTWERSGEGGELCPHTVEARSAVEEAVKLDALLKLRRAAKLDAAQLTPCDALVSPCESAAAPLTLQALPLDVLSLVLEQALAADAAPLPYGRLVQVARAEPPHKIIVGDLAVVVAQAHPAAAAAGAADALIMPRRGCALVEEHRVQHIPPAAAVAAAAANVRTHIEAEREGDGGVELARSSRLRVIRHSLQLEAKQLG